MQMPSTSDINQQRITRFKQRISDTVSTQDLQLYEQLLGDLQQEQDLVQA